MARPKRRSRRRPPPTSQPRPAAQKAQATAHGLDFDDRLAICLAFVGGRLLILEIVAGRLLAPTLGTSLYTWTSVIGVVLAGVSLGNYLGGRIGDRSPSRSTVAVIYVAASLASLAILGLPLREGAGASNRRAGNRAGALAERDSVPPTIDDPRRCDTGIHEDLAPRDRGGRPCGRADPGGGVARKHRRPPS